MKRKWVFLIAVTAFLLILKDFFGQELRLHLAFNTLVVFFATQTFVLFRIEHWVPEEWAVQMSLVKVVLRLLTSLAFILILFYTQDDLFNLVIQFIVLYLVYMIFEIVIALTNLRRN